MDTNTDLTTSQNTSGQTSVRNKKENATSELLGATENVLSDETTKVMSNSKLPEATVQDSLSTMDKIDTNLSNNLADLMAATLAVDPLKPTTPAPDSTELNVTKNDAKTEPDTDSTEMKVTDEKIIGEITLTNMDDTAENSKINLTMEDLPLGVSGMHPLETSSVISEPTYGGVLEATTTTSTTTDNLNPSLSCLSNDDMQQSTKKARLKSCIIRLTELSNSKREKWLTSESRSSMTNKTTESIESSSSSGSRYNMRRWTAPIVVSARQTRRTRSVVNIQNKE